MTKLLRWVVLLGVAGTAYAGTPATLVNGPVASTTTYVVNLNSFPGTGNGSVKHVSAQVVYSSVTLSALTFTDGRTSTGTITVGNVKALLSLSATNQITVPTTAAILGTSATAQITISSCVPTSVVYFNGAGLKEGKDWTCGVDTTLSAGALAGALNYYFGSILTSTNVAGVVYSTADVVGGAPNSYAFTSSSAAAYTLTSWSGGKDRALLNARICFNTDCVTNGYRWDDTSNTTAGTALSIAAWLNTYGVIAATAPTGSSVVYATATTGGVAGNGFTLSASTSTLSVASANFAGGQDPMTLTINGVTLAQGVDVTFTASTTTAQAATALRNAINGKSGLSSYTTAYAIGTVVTATSTVVGAGTKYAWSTNSTGLTLLPTSALYGGTDSSYLIGYSTITIASHGLARGMSLTYSRGSGPDITGLTNNTVYYAVPVDTNNFGLATSLANAVAGTMAVLTSSRTTTPADSFTLTPVAWSQGTAGGYWQASNDGSNWTTLSVTQANVAVPINGFAAVNPSTSTAFDFGPVGYGYLRYVAKSPDAGAVNLRVFLNGSN